MNGNAKIFCFYQLLTSKCSGCLILSLMLSVNTTRFFLNSFFIMCVFRCICLLLIVANCVRCERENFTSNHTINLGSTITIDASKPPVDDITFYGEYSIKTFSINTISVHNFTDSKYGFGILQVHSCWYNLTLSFNKTEIQPNFYENGTNLGFTLYPSRQKTQDIYLHNYNYFTSVNISVALIMYNKTTPEPGGCNMEYSVANAPVLVVTYRKDFISIDTPLAAYRADETNEVKRCNVSLSYMGYHLFLKRGDYTCRSLFDGIKRLMTIGSARDNGILGASVPGGVAHRRKYAAIPGTGIVFQTIVSGKWGTSSTYVPAFSISCSPALWETSCNIFDTATYHVLAGILITVGVIRGYFSHVLRAVSVFIDGFIFGLLTVFYTIYLYDADISEDKFEQFLIIGALFIAILLTILFMCFEVLHKSFTLISNIIVGYLLGAFIVYFIDDYFYDFKSYGWMYETVFVGSILAVMIVITVCPSLGPLVLSATCGSFYIVQGLCYFYGNHLNYVVFNALRYTSVVGFREVHSTPAVNIEDLWFLLLWLVLGISAVFFQLELQKQRHYSGDINERAPLISRMTRGSDEVFESPESNTRFLKQLHSRRH